jgi:hypothetical protein
MLPLPSSFSFSPRLPAVTSAISAASPSLPPVILRLLASPFIDLPLFFFCLLPPPFFSLLFVLLARSLSNRSSVPILLNRVSACATSVHAMRIHAVLVSGTSHEFLRWDEPDLEGGSAAAVGFSAAPSGMLISHKAPSSPGPRLPVLFSRTIGSSFNGSWARTVIGSFASATCCRVF